MRALRALGLLQFHLHFRRAFDVRNADFHFHRKMRRVLNREALKVGQQRRKPARVNKEVVNLFRRVLDFEVAGKLYRHTSSALHVFCGHVNGFQNILIAGAAANISCDRPAHFIFGWLFVKTRALVPACNTRIAAHSNRQKPFESDAAHRSSLGPRP